MLSLPAGARELLRARLDPVSETGRQVLAAAAVIGRSFEVDTVRAVSGRGDEETVAALEELVRRGLVRERALTTTSPTSSCGRSPTRRRASPGGGCCTAGRRTRSAGPAPAAAARHLALAGRDADGGTAYVRAADQARALFANGQALEHLEAALALGHPDPAPLHTATAICRR